jgi:hypothetical protein
MHQKCPPSIQIKQPGCYIYPEKNEHGGWRVNSRSDVSHQFGGTQKNKNLNKNLNYGNRKKEFI